MFTALISTIGQCLSFDTESVIFGISLPNLCITLLAVGFAACLLSSLYGVTRLVVRYVYFSRFHREKFDWIWESLTEDSKSVKPSFWKKMIVADVAIRLCNPKVMSVYYQAAHVSDWSPKLDWRTVMIAYTGLVPPNRDVRANDLYDLFNDFLVNSLDQAGMLIYK